MQPDNAAILILHPADNVGVALKDLEAGDPLTGIPGPGNSVCRESIPKGHKVSLVPLAAQDQVLKYGQVIGVATRRVQPGQHLHSHNLGMAYFDHRTGAADRVAADPPTSGLPEDLPLTFQGFRRPWGGVGTRNYIGVLSTVNCSATVAHRIAAAFDTGRLTPFPAVDGVVALSHGTGCGPAPESLTLRHLERCLAGYARHPNFGGVVLVGLGCEDLTAGKLFARLEPCFQEWIRFVDIQEAGGTTRAIDRGAAMVAELLPLAQKAVRESLAVEHLCLGLECGGSDAYSGITANPALGRAVDWLVAAGGTAVLGETPEIYGAEHFLARLGISDGVARDLIAKVRWWEDYTRANGQEINNNPSPGNKAGGLTTILEKSWGAVAKGGTTPITAVYDYAQPVTHKGLVFMDTPGFDPVSITGMIAGGAQVVCFTTGRGSVFGSKPAPVVKLGASSRLCRRMADDMDFDCGPVARGRQSIARAGRTIYETIVATASGHPTRSEKLGLGDHEFVPWQIGTTL